MKHPALAVGPVCIRVCLGLFLCAFVFAAATAVADDLVFCTGALKITGERPSKDRKTEKRRVLFDPATHPTRLRIDRSDATRLIFSFEKSPELISVDPWEKISWHVSKDTAGYDVKIDTDGTYAFKIIVSTPKHETKIAQCKIE
jgi:hypothetical protein